MNAYTRAGTVVAATALLAAPLAANADTGSALDGPDHGGPAYADITSVNVDHRTHRISATIRMPVVRAGKLARTQVKIQRKGERRIWTVTVRRDRHGTVTSRTLSLKRPGEPTGIALGCGRIRTRIATPASMRVSVPGDCIVAKHRDKRVRVKARIAARVRDDHDGGLVSIVRDSTPFTRYLARG